MTDSSPTPPPIIPRQTAWPSGDGWIVVSRYGDDAAWRRGRVVLMCHGFTGNRIEARRLFVRLARELTASGLAAATFDYRGNGESTGEFEDMTVTTIVEDALAAIECVRAATARAASSDTSDLSGWSDSSDQAASSNLPLPSPPSHSSDLSARSPLRLGLLGFSMGGMAVSLAAARRPEGLRAVTLWAAVARGERSLASVFGAATTEEILARHHFPLNLDGWRVGRQFIIEARAASPARSLAQAGFPALLLHAKDDKTIDAANSHDFADALSDAGVEHRLEILGRGGHAFIDGACERQLFAHTRDFFAQNL